MPELYLVINENALHVYKRGQNGFEAEAFGGEPSFPYVASRVGEAVDKLENELRDNNNLEDRTALSFIVLLSDNEPLNAAFRKALGNRISREIEIRPVLLRAIADLARDATQFIDKFGVNYDGRLYRLNAHNLESAGFSLLACTLTPKDMIAKL